MHAERVERRLLRTLLECMHEVQPYFDEVHALLDGRYSSRWTRALRCVPRAPPWDGRP